MRFSLPFILLLLASHAALADEPAIHTIAADGKHFPPGFPPAAPHVLAIAGKPVRIVWKHASATDTVVLTVDRITDTRRVPITTSSVSATEKQWSWDWSPPLTRGVVTYEITLKKEGITPVRIEVRDPEEFHEQTKALQSMEWEASGLTRSETDALTNLGFRLHSTSTASNQETARLQMTSSDPAQGKRTVTWDQTHHHLVVWKSTTPAGDIDIRAPRWWLSAEALATDEGRIRLFDLFTTSPASH